MLYKKNLSPTLSDELFRNPTSEYRATPFWAWNCKMTNEILTEQIPLMKELLRDFERKEYEHIVFTTMNGHQSPGFTFIGKKR